MSEAAARDDLGTGQPGVAGDPNSGQVAGAGARRGSRPIVVSAVLMVLFLAAAWFATRRGILTDTWPAFLPNTDSTAITRYSGPWLTAAAGALLGAGLSAMALVRAVRTSR